MMLRNSQEFGDDIGVWFVNFLPEIIDLSNLVKISPVEIKI